MKLDLAKPLPVGIEWCPVCQGTMPAQHEHHPRPSLLELAERARRAQASLVDAEEAKRG